jgi:hypothetical protein
MILVQYNFFKPEENSGFYWHELALTMFQMPTIGT